MIGTTAPQCKHCSADLSQTRPILQSYLDESSDGNKEDVFCVGGFLAHKQHWAEMQTAWLERLKIPDEIPYFRATSCKGTHEPFFKLRGRYGQYAQSAANKIRADLEAILLRYPWIGFGIGILMPDYRDVWNSIPSARRLYQEDAVEEAFSAVFYEVARATQKNAPTHQVAYIIDDSTYSGKIAEAFKAVKINHPVLANSMATLAPKDDKITPPLQMADLIASIVKDVFLEWLKNGKPQHVPLEEKWHNHFEVIGKWDKDYMLHNIEATLKDKRYEAGQLAARPVPEPTRRDMKREQKKMRRALVKKLQGS